MRRIVVSLALALALNAGEMIASADPQTTTTGTTSGNVIVNSPGTKIVSRTQVGGRTRTETTTYGTDGKAHTKVSVCDKHGACITTKQ